MSFIKKSCESLKKFNLIILYCANDTCSASKSYANKLVSKCKNLKNKIVLYEGGIYEWALLSFKFQDVYKFYNKDLNKELDGERNRGFVF